MEVIYATEEIDTFLMGLALPIRARTRKLISLLEERGHLLRMPHSKPLGGGIFELRLRGMEAVRLLYCVHKGNACVLHGVVKKDGSLKPRDIRYAQEVKSCLA